MKRLILIFLAVSLLFSFSACGNKKETDDEYIVANIDLGDGTSDGKQSYNGPEIVSNSGKSGLEGVSYEELYYGDFNFINSNLISVHNKVDRDLEDVFANVNFEKTLKEKDVGMTELKNISGMAFSVDTEEYSKPNMFRYLFAMLAYYEKLPDDIRESIKDNVVINEDDIQFYFKDNSTGYFNGLTIQGEEANSSEELYDFSIIESMNSYVDFTEAIRYAEDKNSNPPNDYLEGKVPLVNYFMQYDIGNSYKLDNIDIVEVCIELSAYQFDDANTLEQSFMDYGSTLSDEEFEAFNNKMMEVTELIDVDEEEFYQEVKRMSKDYPVLQEYVDARTKETFYGYLAVIQAVDEGVPQDYYYYGLFIGNEDDLVKLLKTAMSIKIDYDNAGIDYYEYTTELAQELIDEGFDLSGEKKINYGVISEVDKLR